MDEQAADPEQDAGAEDLGEERPAAEPETEPRPRINWPVLIGAGLGVIGITVWAAVDTANAEQVIGDMVEWVGLNLGWWYTLVVGAVLAFVLGVAISRVGKVRLGPDHSRPRYNLFTWTAMLFAAGIGIDLMFFSVAAPVAQYLEPPLGAGGTAEAARQAVTWTVFHYGWAGWGLYALIGMALGYFCYRQGFPLSIRSALRPLLGRYVDGWIGHLVDIAALLGAIFGIATSLGIGVSQLNFGLNFMFGIREVLWVQAALIGAAVLLTTISTVTGVDRGIRRLSEINVLVAIALMIFLVVAGSTAFLFDALVSNVGDQITRFPAMIFDTFAYDRPDEWLNLWTLFFWAWWIAWAPFVGLFLARISRGRTIREFILGTLIVPFSFILVWISVHGNSALQVAGDNEAFGQAAIDFPEQAYYALFEQYPAITLAATVATITGFLFYVTSADSGALVMANFSSKLPTAQSDGSKPLRIFWSVATGALTLVMLSVGGIEALQYATIIIGLPFSVVIVFIMVGLFRSLQVEGTRGASLAAAGAGRPGGWRRRLSRATSWPRPAQAEEFLDTVAMPALEDVRAESARQGLVANLTRSPVEALGVDQAELRIGKGDDDDFVYQLYPVTYDVPAYAIVPSGDQSYVRMEVFSRFGGQGYDLHGCSREQVSTDVMDHYEAHLQFLRDRSARGARAAGELPKSAHTWDADFSDGEHRQ